MKQVCVIGLGQFGTHLARALVKLGCEVLAIDREERRVEAVRDDVHRAVIGDARDAEMLESVLTSQVDEVLVALGETNLEPSILCTLILKRLGVPSIRSTAANDDHAQILRAVGATEVIFPERDSAQRTARQVANPDIRDMFPLGEDYRILEIVAPQGTRGKSLLDLELRAKFSVMVLATRREGEDHFRFMPAPDAIIGEGEVLMVLGREIDLARFSGLD